MVKPAFFTILLFNILTLESYGQQPIIRDLYEQGFSLYRNGEKQKAVEVFEKIFTLDSGETNALDYKTIIYHQLGDYLKAADGYNQLCKIFPDKDDLFSSASFNLILIKQVKEAERYARRAVALNRRAYNNMLNLAHACLIQGKGKDALYWYAKALEWVPSIEGFRQSFISDFRLLDSLQLFPSSIIKNLGVAFEDKLRAMNLNPEAGQYLDSIESYSRKKLNYEDRQTLVEWKKAFLEAELKSAVVRTNIVATFLFDIGLHEYQNRNRTIAQERYFDEAKRFFRLSGDTLEEASFYIALSKELIALQMVENESIKNNRVIMYALDGYTLVLQYGDQALILEALYQLANAYRFEERKTEEQNTLHELLRLSKSYGDATGYFRATNSLSVFHGNQHENDSALYFNQLCLEQIDKAWLSFEDVNLIKINRLETLAAQGKNSEVISNARQLIRQLSPLKNKSYSGICELIGNAYKQLGITDSAYRFYKESVSSYIAYSNETERKGKGTLPVQVSQERHNAIWNLCSMAARQKNADELFYWSEVIRDNLLRYLVSLRYQPDSIVTLRHAMHQLPDDAVAILYTGTHVFEEASFLAFDKTQTQIVNINDHDLNLSASQAGLSNTFSRLVQLHLTYPPTDTFSLARSLPLMQFLYLSSANPAALRGISVKRKEENQETTLAREKENLSKFLYQTYVAPFEKMLQGKKRIIIGAEFMLHFIPFESLRMPDGRYLGEVYDVVYTPGFTTEAFLKQRTYATGNSIVAIGNPDYATYHPELLQGRALDFSELGIRSWTDLPGTDRELESLKSKTGSVMILSGKELSETNLKRKSEQGALAGASVLHFALHGLAGTVTAAEDNSLVITEPKTGTEDGLLQFYEAYELNIKPNLVGLSACETAMGMLNKDGSVTTMGAAFLAAGAKAVLATNWSVDDAATALFIGEVYSLSLGQNISFSSAVAETKRKFIRGDFGEKFKNPLYWAPFKYYGL